MNDACLDGVIEDGVSGILSGDSDDELLAALIRAFGEEGRRIAKTAAQYAAPFSTEGFAAKVEACYMKAIEAHRRGMSGGERTSGNGSLRSEMSGMRGFKAR